MLATFIKKLFSIGKTDGLAVKVDIFYAAGKLSDEEYAELTGLLLAQDAKT